MLRNVTRLGAAALACCFLIPAALLAEAIAGLFAITRTGESRDR